MTFTESYWPADRSSPLVEMTVGDLLRAAAAAAPSATALVFGAAEPSQRRYWTYDELLVEAERVARALLGCFAPGERVAVWAPNRPEWVLLELGAALAGVTLVTVNPGLRPAELRYVLGQSRAHGVFFVDELRGNPIRATVEEIAPELHELRETIRFADWDAFVAVGDPSVPLPSVQPTDPTQLQYTSGTTGVPKGALLHHRGMVNSSRHMFERAGMPAGGAWLNPMPLFHTGGCVMGVLGPMWTRAPHVLVPTFDPGLILELCETERAAGTGAVPTMLLALMEHPDFARRDLSALQVVLSGGSTVPPSLVRRIEETLGLRFMIVFGQTEAAAVSMTRPDDGPDDKGSTIGQPLPQIECKVADTRTGVPVAIGEPGELCARGYLTMLDYFDMPNATAAAIDGDGWLHTGDLATMDERGYLCIAGRLKDMIIRGGENIYPREVEDCLVAHPAVADAVVMGLPDDRWGETVAAVVRLTDPATAPSAEELLAHCRQHLAPHKAPRSWYVTDTFPVTGSGKVQKFVLQDQIASGALAVL